MKLAVASDHCGYEMKMKLLPKLQAQHEVTDFGCYSKEPVDFPDIARKICAAISNGVAERGIMICSTGVGAAIACNKVKGIRATVCHDTYLAHQCVEHDNVQVIAIGGEVIGELLVGDIVDTFLSARFDDTEEHVRRVSKLDDMNGD